ncbi:MAG: hypothetical protein ACRDYX_15795 [Egibacteraceae bacterium]
MVPTTEQPRIRIADTPAAVADCTRELAARLLERWPGAIIVFDQAGDGRQGWLYLPDLRRARHGDEGQAVAGGGRRLDPRGSLRVQPVAMGRGL